MGIFLPPLEFIQADPSRRDLMGMTPLRVVLAQESRRRRFALVRGGGDGGGYCQ